MKVLIAATVTALAFAAPVFADTSTEEYLRMSNESAAERLVTEESMGDVDATRVKLALDDMSPAEKKVFFDKTPADQMEVLNCMKKTDSGDSAAESCGMGTN